MMQTYIILALLGASLVIMPTAAMAITTIHIKSGAYIQGQPGFDPQTANIKVGDTINWKNDDSVPHTATSGNGPSDPHMAMVFDTSTIDPSTMSKDIVINQKGETKYFCSIHPFIVGKIDAQ